ncbi:uncharacterized protein LOC144004739 isoform X2 [Festucalex cinctus]
MSGPAMPTPVSRLPKFGSWSKSSSPTPTAAASHAFPTTRLSNGFYHHPGPAVVGNGTANGPLPSARRIGTIRTPAQLSAKWRKDGEMTEGGGQDDRNDAARRDALHPKTLDKPLPVPKNALPVPKTGLPVPKTGLPVPKTGLPVPKTGLPVSKHRLPVSKSRLTGPKQNQNGLPGSKLRPPQWSTHSGSPLRSSPGSGCGSFPPAARSQSTSNLGSAPPTRLAKGDWFRSRSLAVQRRTSSKTPAASVSAPSLTQKQSSTSCVQVGSLEGPGEAKKSPLPGLKANSVSYKLSRPSLTKQARTVLVEVSHTRSKPSAKTPSSTGSSPERTVEASACKGEPSVPGETPEDMSLSSGSSVDHNRASQEYMDGFDDLGNGGAGALLTKNEEDDSGLDRSSAGYCERRVVGNGVTVTTELHFLDNTLDWTQGTLADDDGPNHLTRFSHPRKSSLSDYHEQGGSSLDLSPSDSCGSGGIYMWDEEGLEPLGGAVSPASVGCELTRHVGSFDSDVNSSDAVTNVDSCDLDDDDLMLDGDFPDDISLHTDGDGTSHMAEWRRRQLCWGTHDVHSDDREAGCYDERDDTGVDADLSLDLSPQRTPGADMEDLAEDFAALRSQLELLRRFLLQDDDTDDDTLTTDTVSPEEGDQSQVNALLQEVQKLKEDLRSKDQIISQLTLQLGHASALVSTKVRMSDNRSINTLRGEMLTNEAVTPATSRCRCPSDKAEKMERHTQTSAVDPVGESVASQTPWREHTAFPPSAFLSPPWQYQRSRPYGGRPKPSIPSHLARKTTGTLPPRPGRAEPTSRAPSKQKLRPLPPSSAHPAPP